MVDKPPLKNMSLSGRVMKFPIYGKASHVPKHQPGNCWNMVDFLRENAGTYRNFLGNAFRVIMVDDGEHGVYSLGESVQDGW